MKRYVSLFVLNFLLEIAVTFQVECSENYAIIGGLDQSLNTYAALVNPNGEVRLLTGPAFPNGTGSIYSVSINPSGSGIIGGVHNADPYIALVNPNGETRALTGPVFPNGTGSIYSVAINPSGSGIIGGVHNGSDPYIALVTPNGETRALTGSIIPVGKGQIKSVAINPSGFGIIGGVHNGSNPYIALMTPNGETKPLIGPVLPHGTGWASSVAINPSGFGIIGGVHNGFHDPYIVLVAPDGMTTALTGPGFPIGDGEVYSVAINPSGSAIIGGIDNGFTLPYAALVAPNGETTKLTGPGLPNGGGEIYSVAINPSGAAIIGGIHNEKTSSYAALVSPNGETRPLTGEAAPNGTGFIYSVAINSSGSAIIGGRNNGFYVSLVAPNGETTMLTGSTLSTGNGQSFCVGIIDPPETILNCIDPKSYGFGNTYANPLFTLSTVTLREHLVQNRVDSQSKPLREFSLVADASGKISSPLMSRPKFKVWVAPFGSYVHDQEKIFGSVRNRNIGGILGFDYHDFEKGMIGGGLAYAFEDINYKEGKAKVNQEFATIYGAWYGPYTTVTGAFFAGIYQLDNRRDTLGIISSKSLVHGGILAPHLGVHLPLTLNQTMITPFIALDWVNNWQGIVKEQGRSGFNLRIGSKYVSLLRSELGIHFNQQINFKKGTWHFEEGVSYVNKTPFNAKEVSTYYVGSISTFNIQLFSNRIHNLFALALGGSFTPNQARLPSLAINYRGEWGSNQFLNTLSVKVEKKF